MSTSTSFSASTNKLAYAQAFSRSSSQHVGRTSRGSVRRSLIAFRTRKHAA